MKTLRHSEVAKSVGKAIAECRLRANLTQEEVSERLNIGHEAISRMERGNIVPNVVRLMELAEVFQCDVTDLLMQGSDRPIDQANVLNKSLAELSGPDRELVLHIIRTLTHRLSVK
ncbi:MAG: hypothetical protein RLZZ484_1927 [Pseudomonadota bacterium]|jgi:transcriptional regulator with XRE-family HTH domain